MRLLIVAIFCTALAIAAPTIEDDRQQQQPGSPVTDDPSSLEYGNYIEGDMIEPFEGAFSGLLNSANRWPSGVIVYKIDSSLSSTSRSRVEVAMLRITEETGGCIKFRKAGSADGSRYVLIRDRDSGCSIGSIMHEFQHTLGIYHQQSRPDRDTYVSIAFENIRSGHEHNFNKRSTSQVSTYGVPYDFGSQMHYSEYAFSSNGQRTIVPRPGKLPDGVRIGQRDRMSAGDVAIVKAMYNCR